MPPKKSSRPTRLLTKDKQKSPETHSTTPKPKNTRTTTTPLTRTIHQMVQTQQTTAAGASQTESVSASSVHPSGVQHAGSLTPAPGYGLPPTAMPPAQWWGPWGPPPQWSQYYQHWPAVPQLQAQLPQNTSAAANRVQATQSTQQSQYQHTPEIPAHLPPVAAYTPTPDPPDQVATDAQQDTDQLVNALTVSTVPGNQNEPILSLHVSQSLKKRIWVGEYVDLAYLIETNPVPEDDKSYEFACTSNSTNKLSLTTAKPKAKVDTYTAWNKAFRVLTEIVALCDPSQCLPMVQYAAELNDNIGKFTFPVTYQYDMKFRLKKQLKPNTPWNVIDNHLWAKCFSGANREPIHNNYQMNNNFRSQRTCDDFNFRTCNRQKCRFQHKCSKCNRPGHTQRQCHSYNPSNIVSGSNTATGNPTRPQLPASNANQQHNTRQTTHRPSQ